MKLSLTIFKRTITMKNHLSAFFLIALLVCAFHYSARAQGASPTPGNTKATIVFDSTQVATYPALPLAGATKPDAIVCFGTDIKLKVGTADANLTYEWTKTEGANTQIVKSVKGDNTYSENTTEAGYYSYSLRVLNGNDCASETDNFRIYVMPDFTIKSSPDATICADQTGTTDPTLQTTVLSVNVPYANTLKYEYSWYKNGSNTAIAGATGPTLTVDKETTATTVTYTARVKYSVDYGIVGASNGGCYKETNIKVTVSEVPGKPNIDVNY